MQAGDTHFRWHARARLFGPDGAEVAPGAGFDPDPADRPGGPALAAVLAGAGRGFRIGGEGAVLAGPGAFETLTGGSLGGARRVIRSQASWIASFSVNARLFGIGPGLRVAVPGRLSHSLALYAAVEALHLGADLHLLDGLRPDRQARELAARNVSLVYATPPQLLQMTAAGTPWPALRQVIVGGARLEPGLRGALARLAPGAAITEFYGAAEASFITMGDASTPAESVGRPYPGVELRIRNSAGQDLPPGEAGEVWVKSPYLFQDYAGVDRGGARWHDGWLSVGEIGFTTPGGLVLCGRAGRMVAVAGQNVFPESVEQFLCTLPGVRRAAVLPVPDPARGHVLLAALQGAEDTDAILNACRAALGPLIAPRRLVWVADWPELASGKTDLAALRAGLPSWP